MVPFIKMVLYQNKKVKTDAERLIGSIWI